MHRQAAFETELRLFEEGLAGEANSVLNEATSVSERTWIRLCVVGALTLGMVLFSMLFSWVDGVLLVNISQQMHLYP